MWRDYNNSSHLTESLTRKNMRNLASQIVRLEQKLGHIHSDQVYAMRMEALIHEERQRRIREMVNSSNGQARSALGSHDYLQLEPPLSASDAAASADDSSERGRRRDRESPRTVTDDYVSPQRDQSMHKTIVEPAKVPEQQAQQDYWEHQDMTASSWHGTNPYKEASAPATPHTINGLWPNGPQKSGVATPRSPELQRRVGREHHVKFDDVRDEEIESQETTVGPLGSKGKGKGRAGKQKLDNYKE
jgi:hypothetical protein